MKKDQIIGITGHRAGKNLGGYNIPNKITTEIEKRLEEAFVAEKPVKVISGMATGVDQLACQVCIKLKIPFIAAVPFLGQELLWPKDEQAQYRKLLDAADSVEIVSRGGYAHWKMQVRNQWIVDNSKSMIAVLRSSIKEGGTFNCVDYARSKNKTIITIDPDKF